MSGLSYEDFRQTWINDAEHFEKKVQITACIKKLN